MSIARNKLRHTNISIVRDNKKENALAPILDSKLITGTFIYKNYDIKLVACGGYSQIYLYEKSKFKKVNNNVDVLNLRKNVTKQLDNNSNKSNSIIEKRNIIRSKLSCQRYAKANMKFWETFITLTFADNIQNIKDAYKKFNLFVKKVRRVKKDFKYLCIPEFQKRGAIHYHILTNINIDDNTLMYVQADNLKYKHIKYWHDGFTSVEKISGDVKKIVGYISKYMTKDIDDRLFGYRRFLCSQNLIKPFEFFINTSEKKDLDFFIKKIQDKDVIYRNEYINPYDNNKVTFLEYL